MRRVDDFAEAVTSQLLESSAVKRRLAEQGVDAILAAASLIADTFARDGKLLICGNGGSAADCQHMAAELTSRLTMAFERPGLPAIALTTDSSFLTAFANDCGFEGVFERQVQALGREGDLVLGISTSGNSENVVRAFRYARQHGLKTLLLCGEGGRLRELADCIVGVPSRSTQHIQEAHLAIEHVLCHVVERLLFEKEGA